MKFSDFEMQFLASASTRQPIWVLFSFPFIWYAIYLFIECFRVWFLYILLLFYFGVGSDSLLSSSKLRVFSRSLSFWVPKHFQFIFSSATVNRIIIDFLLDPLLLPIFTPFRLITNCWPCVPLSIILQSSFAFSTVLSHLSTHAWAHLRYRLSNWRRASNDTKWFSHEENRLGNFSTFYCFDSAYFHI